MESPAPTAFSPAIRADGLTKRFGRVVAVEDLSMTVAPGEVFGFLGPNGAGKSTTIRLLLGLIRPTAGSAAIFVAMRVTSVGPIVTLHTCPLMLRCGRN